MGARSKTLVSYQPENPDKYVGAYPIVMRSSWEIHVAQYFDRHPDVLQWASEPVSIPYFDPTREIQTVYVPDFLVVFTDTSGEQKSLLVEVKPAQEAFVDPLADAGINVLVARNAAKWEAAVFWCQRRGIEFRVMTEGDLFGGQQAAVTLGRQRARKSKRGPMVRRALAAKKGLRKKR